MLFIPEVLYYVSLTNGEPDQVYSLSKLAQNQTTVKSQSDVFSGKYAWTQSQKGFLVKINFRGTDFGILDVDNLEFPEHKEHYLNLTMSISDVCGLAIENARRHQVIKNAENRLRLKNEKLEKALAEVKKLSGLLPICSHYKIFVMTKGIGIKLSLTSGSILMLNSAIVSALYVQKKYYSELDIYDDNGMVTEG